MGEVENSSESGRAALQLGALQGVFSAARRRVASMTPVTSRDELWRYTEPALFPLETFLQAAPVEVTVESFSPGSALPAGITVRELQKVDGAELQLVKRLLEGESKDLADNFVAELQLASISGGALVSVQRGVEVLEPVAIRVRAPRSTTIAPLVVVHIPTGSSVTILDDLAEGEGFLAPRIEVLAEAGSRFQFYSVQSLPRSARYLARHRFHVTRDVSCEINYVAVGAQSARVDLDCRMLQAGASATIRVLYLADGDRHVDFHPVQSHIAPHCYSNLTVKGALKDTARGVYYGYVKVAEGAQKTDAYQKNRNLVLSPEARADSIPNLEILANDVKCSHGSSLGEINHDELFYLRSRGLSVAAAERLLLEGFFDEVLVAFGSEKIRDYCQKKLLGV